MFYRAECMTGWLIAFTVMAGSAAGSAVAPQAPETDLNVISMEVSALQTLAGFKFTQEQLVKLQGWVKETVSPPRKRAAAKVSPEFRDKLLELHAALVDGSDDDKIDALSEELEDLRTREKPSLDDAVDLTKGARTRAPQIFHALKVQQVAGYIAGIAEELFDPLDKLTGALQSARTLTGTAWNQRRQEITDDIVRVAAGVDAKAAGKLAEQIDALLVRAHGLSKAEFKAKRAELEKAAAKLVGNIGVMELLRNETESALAELMSNPRFSMMLEIRLKKK